MPTRYVNDRQQLVLKWIADGCPERNWPDETHKHSARALANRDLVRVARSGGKWTATLTEAGRYYVEHGEYPDGHRFGPKALEPEQPEEAPAAKPTNRGRAATARVEEPGNDWAIDSPTRLKRRGKGTLAKAAEDAPTHPWDDRVLISAKEAAWLLSVSEHMIRDAVRMGDIDRVFIGAGTTNYRIVYDSLLAWVNTMPTEPVRSRW
jgi:hypothetical protein